MKITVDRLQGSEGALFFTITVTQPHVAPITDEEIISLNEIDRFTETMARTLDPNSVLYQDILNANHRVKEKVFVKILDSLKFSIQNELQTKFKPICQEIYNWIQDEQHGFLKRWMTEFDPQRTKYYFDNDPKLNASSEQQESEHDEDDDLEEDDED